MKKSSKKSIWSIDGTIKSITTQDQSGPGSNGNKVVTPLCFRIGASQLNSVLCHTLDTYKYIFKLNS